MLEDFSICSFNCACALQYAELVFATWNGRQVFNAVMVGITLAACLRTTLRTYRNRKMLIR